MQHHIASIGPAAARVLAKQRKGKVAAVFERSIYCVFEGEYICIGAKSLDMCPLNAVTTIPAGRMWSSNRFQIDMPAVVASGNLRIGTSTLLDFSDALIWRPSPPSDLSYRKVLAGISVLENEVSGRIPADGLGRFIDPALEAVPSYNGYTGYAEQAISNLKGWIGRALRDPSGNTDPEIGEWLCLLGLGPGLTPSGDDLIGGVMLALQRLGQLSNLRSLSSAVATVMDERTNSISTAHLRSAMEGMGNDAVHRAMDAILTGNRKDICQGLEEITRVGHTSGWDTLAGAVIAIRLWLEVNGKGMGSNHH